MDAKTVAAHWEANAENWTRYSRAGYDKYRDALNTPAFLAFLPEVAGHAATRHHVAIVAHCRIYIAGKARLVFHEGSFEKEILAAYKAKYCKAPGKYAVIGFDVMNDMLTRENKKGEIFKQMNKVQTQLATKFEFVKSKTNGAYVNTGFRVIRLVP